MTLRAVAAGSGGGAPVALVVGNTTVSGGAAYAVLREDGSQLLTADGNLTFAGAAAGTGLVIAAGTATTDVSALSITRTNNDASVATGVKITFTDTSSASGFLPFQILGGAAGSTNLLSVGKGGDVVTPGNLTATGLITGGNITTAGTGTAGNLVTGGNLTITGSAKAGTTGGTTTWSNTAGAGPTIAAGTAASAVNGLTVSQSTTTGGTGANVVNLSGTWNANAAASTAVLVNMTDTSSHAATLLMDLQIAGTSKFNVAKGGAITIPGAALNLSSNANDRIQSGGNYIQVYTGGSRKWVFNNATIDQGSGIILGWSSNADPLLASSDTGLNRVSAGLVGVSTGGSGVGGSLSLTNLTTIATSSTGTAAIFDTNVLRPLTSAERFKTNIRRDWAPTKDQIAAFLSDAPMVFDYKDNPARTGEIDIVKDGKVTGKETVTLEEMRPGVKDVLGMSADKAHELGLSMLINYDADSQPYSFREHALIAFIKAILANHETRLNKAGI